jgi:peptidoglycan-associated lipoprotein
MRRISLLAGLGFALVALTGCPPTYPKCDNDGQCSEKGEVCVQGQCQECATDANCKEGFACQGNRCTPKAQSCTDDAACGSGKICEAGTCAPAQCADNSACGEGSCQNGRCVAKAEGTCTGNADCAEGQTCQAGKCAADASAACDFSPVSFGFNEATLSGDAQGRLSDIANCLKGQSTKLTLAGHADERGTEEYNLQLSNRRAAAVKRYLVDLGVPANRMETVGYGENRPVANGQDEASWAQNRRVEFIR